MVDPNEERNGELEHKCIHQTRTSLQKELSQEVKMAINWSLSIPPGSFLESKVKDQNMVQVMGKVCPYWQWVHNASMTKRGRIILSWHPRRYQFNMILKIDQLIHGEAIHLLTNMKFYITFVYGRNLEDQRIPLWGDLMSLAQSLEDPWYMLGDFNSVLKLGERIGGVEVTDGETSDFAACIKQCGLQEFNYKRAFFTWTNKTVWSRIDRALHNELYLGALFFSVTCGQRTRDSRTWLNIAWHSIKVAQLNRNKYANIYAQWAKVRNDILHAQALLQQDPFNTELLQWEANSREHYIAINHSTFLLIKQQSKEEWISFRDKCSRIFIARIKQRKALTSIFHIRDQNDQRVEGFVAVSEVMTTYYKRLLGGEGSPHNTY
ncbi:hypothetical protein Cgig2_020687 [Carnegiea gigantea]|uniref:Reverse transcriptase n=1 Tax=Carnegiea gigantea TaxID=171969 RepID=A0A9Q1JWH0_9CARY|nr:hypothetical protein Cgig2_020687 [Carnegiea gigantea]